MSRSRVLKTALLLLMSAWSPMASSQAFHGCDSRQAAELKTRLTARLETWAAQQPRQALAWAQRLEHRRGDYLRQGHNACSLYRQLLDELDRQGGPHEAS
ncbi:hypothetical protein ACFPTY_09135 [Halomonas beimenensis]|uniref:Secreted protein n=1 Tax=Halomonas beimenensis TaxID=475662 RepID=A0A291P8I2_9GAMM|nr:hypothetical protein BEI_2174 [Halomonas beimenensis]